MITNFHVPLMLPAPRDDFAEYPLDGNSADYHLQAGSSRWRPIALFPFVSRRWWGRRYSGWRCRRRSSPRRSRAYGGPGETKHADGVAVGIARGRLDGRAGGIVRVVHQRDLGRRRERSE